MKRLSQGVLLLSNMLAFEVAAEIPREWWAYGGVELSGNYGQVVGIDPNGDVFSVSGNFRTNSTIDKLCGSNGELIWQKQLPGWGASMMVNKDGDPIIAGTLISGSNAKPAREVFTTKLTGREGAVIWDKRFVDPLSSNIWVEDLTLDQSGDVVLLGSIQLTPTNISALVIKYNGTNGAVRWERRIGTNEWYAIHTMALTHNGDVALGGTLGHDLYVAKISGADGTLSWQSIRSHTNNPPTISDITVDSQGDVVITGGTGPAPDPLGAKMYTAKFSGADGLFLWEDWKVGPRRRPAGGGYVASAEGAQVVVAGARGSEAQTEYRLDLFLVRYDQNGTVLWEKSFSTGSNIEETAAGLFIDDEGNFIVPIYRLGFSFYPGNLLGIDGKNGNVLWTLENTPLGYGIHHVPGLLALTGQSKDSSGDEFTSTKLYRIGTVLSAAKLETGEIELSWPANRIGWKLERASASSNVSSATLWRQVENSEMTNLIRQTTQNSMDMFRLVK